MLQPQERPTGFRRAVAVLVAFSLYCTGLEIARIVYEGSRNYDFLMWNLFLAWIPFAVAWVLAASWRRGMRAPGLMLLGVVWLLVFPNAPYIITDFVHVREPTTAPLWYDVVLIASFAFNGLLLGFVSLSLVQQVVAEAAGAVLGWFVAALALVLAAFGIFIGRVEARNSWDVIVQPAPLGRDTWSQLTSPAAYARTLGVTASYAVFLILAYLALRVVAATFPAVAEAGETERCGRSLSPIAGDLGGSAPVDGD